MILELTSLSGEKKKYRVFKVKPTIGCFIKVRELSDEDLKESLKNSNRYKDLSFSKVYQVYRLIDTCQVVIKDDLNTTVQLYPSQYEVVEEISAEEILQLQKDQRLIKTIDRLVKKTVNK